MPCTKPRLNLSIADLRNEISKSEKDKAELEKGVREQIATQQALRDREAEEKRQLACNISYTQVQWFYFKCCPNMCLFLSFRELI